MTRTLSRTERIAWAQLARTPRVGPLTFHRLIAKYRTASAALEALPRFSDLSPPSADRIEAEIDGLERINARLLASSEPDYPTLLAQLDAPPPLLAVRGDIKWLKQPSIAIVGSREASGAALMFAERLARDLGAAGFTVVSGLARGLDGAAHKGALATGTVAVLAGGLDHPYPPQNLKLHEAICERGAVVILKHLEPVLYIVCVVDARLRRDAKFGRGHGGAATDSRVESAGWRDGSGRRELRDRAIERFRRAARRQRFVLRLG